MDPAHTSPSEKFLPGLVQPVKGTPAYRRHSRGAQRCYKPMSTRLPFLSGVLFVTAALIVIVEVACRQYPVVTSQGDLFGFNITRRLVEDVHLRLLGLPRDGIVRARDSSSSATDAPTISDGAGTFTSYSTANAPPNSYIPTTTPETIVRTLTTGPGEYIPSTTDPGAYIPTTTDPNAYIPTFTTIPGAYLPTTTSIPSVVTTITLQTAPSAYIPTTTPQTWSQHFTFPSAYIPESTTTPSAYIPNTTPDAYIPTTTPTTDPKAATTVTLPDGPLSEVQTFTTIPGAYIPTTPTIQAPSTISTNPGAYIPTSPSDGGETSTTDPGAYIPTKPANAGGTASTTPLVPVSTYTSGGVAMVVMGIPSITTLVPVSTYTSGGVAMVVMGLPSTNTLVPVSTFTTDGVTMVVMGNPAQTSLVPVSTYTSNGLAVVVVGLPTSQPKPSMTLTSTNPYSVTVEQVTSISGSVAYVYTTTRTISPGLSASSTASIPASPQTTGQAVSEHAVPPFTAMNYFTASYLPTLVAVAFRVIWSIVYNNARLMEPFCRLVSSSGSSGKHSLGNLYLSMGTVVPEPLLALLSGHSYMLLVSTIASLIELVAPLSSELLGVDVRFGCTPQPGADANHPCLPRMIVHLLPARILQGLLGLIAVLIILTMFLGRTRSSGVYSNPSSIAVMASLLHHPDVLADFKLLEANDAKVERVINDQTYKLGHYQAEGEGMKYGIVPVVKVLKHGVDDKGTYAAIVNPEAAFKSRTSGTNIKRHIWRILGDISLSILMLGALGVAVAYYLEGADNGFNRFFNSQNFGPRFILVFAAGIIVSQWKRLEREVRTVQPYRRLTSTPSSPFHTILSTTTSTPWSTFPVSIVHLDFFTAIVAFCYIISEILVIVIATIPFSASQYFMGYLAGTYITFSILGLQVLVFIALVSWWRWTGPSLDRDPDTLLGVWTLLLASSIREDFEDLGTAGRHDLVATVVSWRKQYWLGRVVGKDSVLRMGIHADPPSVDNRFEEFRDVPPVTVSPPVP